MGVIYRLKPEIVEFIITKKKEDPNLSCRKLEALILEKFQTNVSKSSVNAVIKEQGLSMPVGRRRKKKRRLSIAHALATIPEQTKEPAVVQEPLVAEKPIEELPVEEKPLAEQPIPEKPAEEKPQEETPIIEQPIIEKPVEEEPVIEQPIAKEPEIEQPPIEEPVKEEPVVEYRKIEQPMIKEPEKIKPPVSEPPVEAEPVVKTEPVKAEFVQEGPQEFEELGAIMLRAADYLAGGSLYINKLIRAKLQVSPSEILTKTEALIYPFPAESGFWKIFQQHFSSEEVNLYAQKLECIASLPVEIKQIVLESFDEAYCLKVNLSDGTTFYLDGQFYTIWSTPNIPHDFSTTLYNMGSRVDKYFKNNSPVVLFMAPGYEIPTTDFFNFVLSMEMRYDKPAAQLIVCGNKFEEIQKIALGEQKRREFVFGLWPWQFKNQRRVKVGSEYKLLRFNPLGKDFYIAEAEVELIQPAINETVKLRGCALKKSLVDKISVIILSNATASEMKLEDLARLYLNRWPNLDETFQDFSRKVELFTYAAESRRFLSPEKIEAQDKLSPLWERYFDMLDMYVRWHFFSVGYEGKDFVFMKEKFYSLKGKLARQEGLSSVTLNPPAGYAFSKDLEYACRRINEKEILLSDGSRLWLSAR